MDTLNETFVALSDPTRRTILERLRRGTATVNELAEPFGISQQAISKHVAYLERARLVEKRREGRQQFCTLQPRALKDACLWMDQYRRLWDETFDRLDLFLEQSQQRKKKESRNVRKR